MNEALRRSVAHARVVDVSAPALDEAAAHHVFAVLRASDGETVTVTDGAGSWRECRIVGRSIEPAGSVQFEHGPAQPLTLAVALPKGDRAEWMVQKATEIGIDRIVLLEARRSVVRWRDERARKGRARLQRVAVEAAMQSRRVYVPKVTGPVVATEFLNAGPVVVAEPDGRQLDVTDRVVAVGPEGGWDASELTMASATVDLGPNVLRVETAALVAAAGMTTLRRHHSTASPTVS